MPSRTGQSLKVKGTGTSEVWTYKWRVTEVLCQLFSSSYSSVAWVLFWEDRTSKTVLWNCRFIPYSIKVCVCVHVRVCVLCCGMCTSSTVAYWGSGRATVACEHSNIIIMILPQIYCAVCRWSSSVGLVTKVQAEWSGAQILMGGRAFSFPQNAQTGSGAHPVPCLLAVKWLGLEADHFYWVLRLIVSGAVPTLNPHAFVICTGMTVTVLLCSVEPG
jgi:hypothetical protein